MLKNYFANKTLLFAGVIFIQSIAGIVEGMNKSPNWEDSLKIEGVDISRKVFFDAVKDGDFWEYIYINYPELLNSQSSSNITEQQEAESKTAKKTSIPSKNIVTPETLDKKLAQQPEKEENTELCLSEEFQAELDYWDAAFDDQKNKRALFNLYWQTIFSKRKIGRINENKTKLRNSNNIKSKNTRIA